AIAFDDADDEMDGVRAGSAGEAIDGRARNVDAALPVPPKVFAPFIGARADDRAEVEAARIPRDERFRKEHELRALLRGLAGQTVQRVDRPLAIEDDGCGLHDGNCDRTAHHPSGSRGYVRQRW